MAECSYARCVQERRAIKKELQRWTKNIVFLVGLERVAEELMGRRKWKKYQELVYNVPLKAGEETQTLESAKEIKDWEPEDRCCFCDGGVFLDSTKQSPHSESSQSSRDTPPLTEAISAAFPHLPLALRHPTTDSALPVEGGEGASLGPLTPPISQTIPDRTPFHLLPHHRHRRIHSERTTPNASLVAPTRIPTSTSTMTTLEPTTSMAASLVTEVTTMSSRPGVSPSTTSTANAAAVAAAASIAPQFFPPAAVAGMFPWFIHQPHGNTLASQLQGQRHGPTPPTPSEEDRGSSVESSSSDVEEDVNRSRIPSSIFPPVLPTSSLSHNPLPPPPRTSSTSPSQPITLSSCLSLEQPLDLSAKATRTLETPMENMMGMSPVPPSSLRVPSIDNKHIFKAKPRMSALGGRRTYTEEELQAALRDIQSGKLGTRRAAVIYGIPRSTLRNKVCAPSDLRVYKLAMERERNHTGGIAGPVSRAGRALPGSRGGYFQSPASLTHNPPVGIEIRGNQGIEEEEEEESEVVMVASSGRLKGEGAEGHEDANEDESMRRVADGEDPEGRKVNLSMDDLVQYSGIDGLTTTESLRQLLQGGPGGRGNLGAGNNPFDVFTSPDLLDKAALAPYIASMFAGSGVLGREGMSGQEGVSSPVSDTMRRRSGLRPPAGLPELMRRIAEEREGSGQMNGYHREGLEGSSVEVCGVEQEEEGERTSGKNVEGGGTEAEGSVGQREEEGSREASVTSPAPNVILKIPSYKPTKNGVAGEESSQSLTSVGGPACADVGSESSSPVPSPVTGIGGLRALGPRELMARAMVNQRFGMPDPIVSTPEKRVGNIFQSDTKRGRFGSDIGSVQSISCDPSKTAAKTTASTTTITTSTGTNVTGGKGTRPKRGKYRNYDRDSLVEAVRAVQRGEMSVHRAGSYYGVPHSTLEYKVKERHLMRPRKREPKGQQHNMLGKQVSNTNFSPSDIGDRKPAIGIGGDKMSKPPTPTLPHVKSKVPQTFGSPHCAPPISMLPPNGGLKLRSPFEGKPATLPASPSPSSSSPSSVTYPTASPHPNAAAFPFWPPAAAAAAAFHSHLPMEISREQFFASAMMQMLQADATGGAAVAAAVAGRQGAPGSTGGIGSGVGNGTNPVVAGSFLDGLIRSRLEMGIPGGEGVGGPGIGGGAGLVGGGRLAPEGMSNVTLLDQLCRNSRLGPLSRSPTCSPPTSAPQHQSAESVVDLSRVPLDEQEKGHKGDSSIESTKVAVDENKVLTDEGQKLKEDISDSKCSLKSACDMKEGSAAKEGGDDCVSCPVTENADRSVVDLDEGDLEVMEEVQGCIKPVVGSSEIQGEETLKSEEMKSEKSEEVGEEVTEESASPLPEEKEENINEENTKSNID